MPSKQVIGFTCNKSMKADNLPRHQQVCRIKHIYEQLMPRRDCKNINYQRTENDVQHDDNNIRNNKYKKSNNTIHQFFRDNLGEEQEKNCLLYTSPSPRDRTRSRMPSSA